ncbi:MAG: presenilin family intramembrane aspartyl protease [Candidatus Micrarchaeia archaeon]
MNFIYKMILFFILAQILGALVGVLLITNSILVPEFEEMRVTPIGETGDLLNGVFFIFYILFGAVVFYLVIKYYKGVFVFRSMEFIIILFASSIVFFVLLYSFVPGLGINESFFIGFLIALILAGTKWLTHKARNIAAILSSAGVGAVFGFSLGFWPAVLLTIGLSIYDYIAVFKTKHMITFAKTLSEKNLSFSLQVQKTDIKKTQKTSKQISKNDENYSFKGNERQKMELGTGDLIMPIMLSVSSFYVFGILGTLFVILGAVVSFILLIYYISKRKLFLPALPPLITGCLISLGILYLLSLFFGI